MVRDAADPVYEHHSLTVLSRLKETSDVDRLVEIHASRPRGPHPDELARILNIFRARDTHGKALILSLPGEAGWRIAEITGRREEGSVSVGEQLYDSIEDAEHAVFLARMRACGLLRPSGGEA
jgi:hypothetical protein